MEPAPTTKLSTGIRVANFSSPHQFDFSDGSVLGACSPDRSRAFSMRTDDIRRKREKFDDVEQIYCLTDKIVNEIDLLEKSTEIDIIILSIPIMEAIKTDRGLTADDIAQTKLRTIVLMDRTKKLAAHDAFRI